MSSGQFWLTVEQPGRLELHLPRDTRGKPRVDAPSVHGSRKSHHNRFVRWVAKGAWEDLFHALAAAGGSPAQVMIASTAVRVHRSASGGKGGSMPRSSGCPMAAEAPKSMP